MQLQYRVEFGYDCPAIRSSKAVDLIAQSFLAMKLVLDFALDD